MSNAEIKYMVVAAAITWAVPKLCTKLFSRSSWREMHARMAAVHWTTARLNALDFFSNLLFGLFWLVMFVWFPFGAKTEVTFGAIRTLFLMAGMVGLMTFATTRSWSAWRETRDEGTRKTRLPRQSGPGPH